MQQPFQFGTKGLLAERMEDIKMTPQLISQKSYCVQDSKLAD